MMKEPIKCYAIKDKLNGYAPPIPFLEEELAKRWFKEQVATNVSIHTTPEDYELYLIGTYVPETATFSNCERTLIAKGVDYGNNNS